MFVPLFRRHTAVIKRAFQDVSWEELQQLELVLKKIGKRAETLGPEPTQGRNQRNADRNTSSVDQFKVNVGFSVCVFALPEQFEAELHLA